MGGAAVPRSAPTAASWPSPRAPATSCPGTPTGGTDVFVHDRQTGTTERVSVDSLGNEGNGSSANPSISADGRFVAFDSGASNLVPGDTNGGTDVFVHDRQTGTTERASGDSAGHEANDNSRSRIGGARG